MNHNYIPTFDECNNIVKTNSSFIKKDEILNNKYKITTFGYRLSTIEDFELTGSRNLRGITFNSDTGELLALPMHKFWNYNENKYVEYNKVKDKTISRVSEKYDGSLVYFFMIKNKLYCKTKMNCFSEQAEWAFQLVNNNKNLRNSIEVLIKNNYTPMFEFISPRNKIVINYNKEELKYICSRSMITGNYIYGNIEGTESVKSVAIDDVNEVLSIIKNFSDNEGFVISFTDNDMIKFKTEEYFELHKLRSSIYSDNTLAYNILYENIDDIRSMLIGHDQELLDYINNFEKKILNIFNNYTDSATTFYINNSFLDRKKYAIKAQTFLDKLCFGLAMNYYVNGSVDVDKLKKAILRQKLWKVE